MSFVLQVFEYNPENPSWDLVSNATNFVKSKKKLGIYCDINSPMFRGIVWEIYECVSEVLSHLGRMFGMIFRVRWGL